MAVTKEDVVAFIDEMTVLEMSQFVKELEEKYDVTAAVPAMAVAAPAAEAEAAAENARGSQFVFSQHCKSMRYLGFSEEQIEAIPHWQAADCFDEIQRLVLAYTDCLVLDGGRTPDGLFQALQTHLDDEEILELTYITCMYDMHATMCRALQLEYDNVAERVIEIPAPEGGPEDGGDILQAVDD